METCEILQFKCIGQSVNRNKISKLFENGKFGWEDDKTGYCTLKEILKVVGTFQSIHSVKRPDSLIFTVGDIVNQLGEIKKIRRVGKNEVFYYEALFDNHVWINILNINWYDHMDNQRTYPSQPVKKTKSINKRKLLLL